MDLKEYITNVIVSISEAVEQAQTELKDSNTIVIPPRTMPGKNGEDVIDEYHGGNYRPLQHLEFDVFVSVNSKDTTGGKGAIKVAGLLEIGGDKNKENLNQQNNRLKFKIPVAFATDKK